ncbi:sugar transferase [Ilumatobacter sp.]|uniref:sugar transferase n=1 Tax=Ilumatobacter sp. TaxID=1967498 RepID=UPI003C436B04
MKSFKRVIDVTIGAVALAVLSPIIAATAVLIRVVDGSPVTFRQPRSGRGGRPFELVKFRTMCTPTADQRGPEHDGARMTRTGRWLRATSLDELPTLVHVLRGQMSLVGPRPLPVEYLRRYDDTQARRLEVRPGVTGWAQVHGRNRVPWDEKFALDVWYVDHASLRLDARILAMTVQQVLRRDGIDHEDGTTMTEFLGNGE